jgi:hypothetical protein
VRGTLARVYAIATALIVFFVSWALIAAKPWATPKATASPDKRLLALDQRQRRLRAESIAVRKLLTRRWTRYRAALARRERKIARVRQLWVEHEVAVARARAAAAAHYVSPPAATASTAATGLGGTRTVTSVRTVVVGPSGGSTQRTAAPSSSPAPTAPAQPAPAPAPAPTPPPPPPPVMSSPPSSNTHSS